MIIIISITTISTSSRYSLSLKRVSQGTCVGRNRDKDRKSIKQMVSYIEKSDETFEKVFEQRSFEILQNILLNKTNLLDIITGKKKKIIF